MNTRCAMMLLTTAGWVLTVSLMLDATVDWNLMVAFWAVVLAFMACVPTYWLILDHLHRMTRDLMLDMLQAERQRTDDRTEGLVLAVAHEFAHAEIPRLEDRRQA